MIKQFMVLIALLIAFSLAAAQCGSPAASTTAQNEDGAPPDIKVMAPSARASIPNGAVYLTLVNEGGSNDVLVGATTESAGAVELHETEIDENGVARMNPLERLEVLAGETVKLEPGGKHIMLVEMKEEIAVGDKISLTLNFEKSGAQTIEVEVTEGLALEPDAAENGEEHHEEAENEAPAEGAVQADPSAESTEHDHDEAGQAEPAENAPALSTEIAPLAQVFQVLVATYLMDTTGFHEMDERLNQEGVIRPEDAGTVERVNRVLAATGWPESLKPQADQLMAILSRYTEVLANDDIEGAKPLGSEVHEAQHTLSEAIESWPGEIDRSAKDEPGFRVAVASYLLDTAGLQEINERLGQEGAIQAGDAGVVGRVNRILVVTGWPEDLQLLADPLITLSTQYAEALSNDDAEAAKPLAAELQQAQQALTQAAAAWLAGKAESQGSEEQTQRFQVAVATHFMDTAGFHDMDERLNQEGTILPGDAEAVNRVKRTLTVTAWPENLKPQAEQLLEVLNRYAEALTGGEVEAAKPLGAEVHEAQHDLSQGIQDWLGESAEPAGEHDHAEEEEHDQPQEEGNGEEGDEPGD